MRYAEAKAILDKAGQGEAWTEHCAAVASFAEHFGQTIGKKLDMNKDFLRTAALLHDIGRCKTHDPVMHGVEGYRMLTAMNHPREAYVCASHIFFGLSADEAAACGLPRRDFTPRSLEEKLVPLMDFLVEFDRPTTLQKRFDSLRRRNRNNPDFLNRLDTAEQKAVAFMNRMNRKLGASMEDAARAALGGEREA